MTSKTQSHSPHIVRHVGEYVVVGSKAIAERIGYAPREIPRLVQLGHLLAWKTPGSNIWKALPEDLKQFNVDEKARYLR